MYDVLLSVTISDGEENVVLHRSIKLPFPPYPELWLHGLVPEEDLDAGSLKVVEVVWSMEESAFYARLQDDEPVDEEASGEADPAARLQAAVDFYGHDWEEIERYRNDEE